MKIISRTMDNSIIVETKEFGKVTIVPSVYQRGDDNVMLVSYEAFAEFIESLDDVENDHE